MELGAGWLEPLLDRIARNSTNVVTPIIDVIDDSTFQYHYGPGVAVGGFDWNLQVASILDPNLTLTRFEQLGRDPYCTAITCAYT